MDYTIILPLSFLLVGAYSHTPPNILYLLVDDLGYNDIGYHDPTIQTPVITQLAAQGIILENNYVGVFCSPSRAALLTGRYSFNIGYHHGSPIDGSSVCLTKEHPILPEAIQAVGYSTYMLGKWHMGMCNLDCTPTGRGFDRFYGFYLGGKDYYTHISEDGWYAGGSYYDFQEDSHVNTCAYGQYSEDLFRTNALQYIDDHVAGNTTKNKPFFMYFSFQTVHSPYQVPEEYLQMHLDEPIFERRVIKAMLSVTDTTIGELVQKLKQHDLYENTIIIFSSDNGGAGGGSLNAPLRGAKATVWEGGVRVPGFVHSPLLKASAGTTTYGLFHQTDWFPTIMALIGGSVPNYVDGLDQSDMLINGGASRRDAAPIHYDQHELPTNGQYAIRVGRWKLIKGYPGGTDGYDSITTGPNALHRLYQVSPSQSILDVMMHGNPSLNQTLLRSANDLYLFDLEADPTEVTNLACVYPEVVQRLERVMEGYIQTAVQMDPDFFITSPEADPQRHGGVWTPGWC